MLFHGSPPWIVSPWLKKWRFGGSAPNRANKTPFDSDAQSKRIKGAASGRPLTWKAKKNGKTFVTFFCNPMPKFSAKNRNHEKVKTAPEASLEAALQACERVRKSGENRRKPV
jgi:hypothetical protein